MKRKCLLIWPPLVNSSTLPLGIPFLMAYLKNKGVDNIKAFDMDVAYLKKLRFYYSLYMFIRFYRALSRGVLNGLKKFNQRGLKNSRTKSEHAQGVCVSRRRRYHFLMEKATHLYGAFDQKMTHLLAWSIVKAHKRIPWALESMIDSFLKTDNSIYVKNINQIVRSVLRKNDFPMIGISAIYPKQFFFALIIAAAVKKINKNIKVIIGGAQITKHITRILNNPMKVYDVVDFFVANDGEETLFELLGTFSEDNLSNVPNLYFKNKDIPTGGFISPPIINSGMPLQGARQGDAASAFCKNKIASPSAHNDIPAKEVRGACETASSKYIATQKSFCLQPKDFPVPDFRDFNLDFYEDRLPILVSKGCWWGKCSFCTYASMQNYVYHITSVDKAVHVIKSLKETYKVSKVNFVDDALTPKFMKELAETLIKDGIKIDWNASIILTRDFDNPDFCNLLSRAGLTGVSIGLESISPRILNRMNKYHKDISRSEIEKIFRTIKDQNIRINLHIIFGFPTETIDEARQTLDFLMKNRDLYDSCQPQAFSLEEKTPICANPQRYGISKVYTSDKNYGIRLGYYFEVVSGMSPKRAREFVYGEVKSGLKR